MRTTCVDTTAHSNSATRTVAAEPPAHACAHGLLLPAWRVVGGDDDREKKRVHTHTHTHVYIYKYVHMSAFCGCRGKTSLRLNTNKCVSMGHLVLGLASGLEAFSREPPCDGFGALAVRQTPETRGTAWEFLSYYPILPSRYLRDPFTISHKPMHVDRRMYLDACVRGGRTKYYPPPAGPKSGPTPALRG